jgi:hypothetical protein
MFTCNFLKTLFYRNIYHSLICWSDDFIPTYDEVDELWKKLGNLEALPISEWTKYFQSLVEEVRSQKYRWETYINLGLLCNIHWKQMTSQKKIQTNRGLIESDYPVNLPILFSDERRLDLLKSQERIPFPEIEKEYWNITQ